MKTNSKKVTNARAKRPSRGKNKGKEKASNDFVADSQDAADEGNIANELEGGETVAPTVAEGEVARMQGE
jgi:hypothetical protein